MGKITKIIVAIIIILLAALSILLSIYGDLFWFESLGYSNVFLTILFTSIGLGALLALGFLAFSLGNFLAAKRLSLGKGKPGKRKEVTILIVVLALVFALVIGLAFSRNWETLLKFTNQVPFGIQDPVFGLDIGFFVFSLPFYQFIFSFLLATLALTIVLTVIAYLSLSSKIKVEEEEKAEKEEGGEEWGFFHARGKRKSYKMKFSVAKEKLISHVSLLIGLLFFVFSFGFILNRYGLLLSKSGMVYGAGYTDLSVFLPLYLVLAAVSFIVGLLFLVNVKLRAWKIIKAGIGVFVLVSVIGFLIGGIYQGLIVSPDEFNLEKPYIERNIQNTLTAYNLQVMEERTFPVSYNLTIEDIEKNSATISNIRLWDWRPLQQTYNQLQLFRTYYSFPDIDIDRYLLDGLYKQVMISPREMNVNNLPSQARTWVNSHLVYTHGYGVVMNPVDRVSKDGLPEFYMKDIPPESPQLSLDRPEIYYGQETSDYVVVRSTTNELDYPLGDQNIYTTYEGNGGVALSDLFRRLAYAVKFKSIELLVSGSIKPESRILFNRNVDERANEIARFLLYDPDPYIVVSGGRLYWIIDAYTSTNAYPYSEPIILSKGLSLNYIRNSVKVVVDAYNGDVSYYIIDPDDPLIKVYQKIFPGLFQEFSQMPEDLQDHIRYPEGLFKIQAAIYSDYHMKDPQVFYNKEDVWVIPDEIYRKSRQQMIPYYMIMKLPGEEKEEFILMLPFTPRGKENMIGWMAASSDFPDYGKLVVYQFSKQELIYGPMQIEARIDQDAEISQLITLWSQAGSQVIRGNTLVIPIEDSILYIEPLYLEATERGTLPQLKRVIAVYGDKLTMKETLDEALTEIFGAAPSPEPEPTPTPTPGTPEEKLQQIKDLYQNAQDALKAGDLKSYADYMDQIGNLLI